jgi:muramidase (phage lysozyme)
MPDLDFAGTMRAAQQLVPDYVQQDLERRLGKLQTQAASAQLQQVHSQLAEDQDYTQSMAALTQNGHAATANDFASVAMRHPTHATAVKDAFNLLESGQQQEQLGTLSQMWAALGKGRNDLATNLIRRRVDASKAQGGPADPDDQEILDDLESDDPARVGSVRARVGMLLASISGPEKFAANWGAVQKGTDNSGRHVVGRSLVDDEGRELFRSAPDETNALEVGVYDDQGHRIGTQLVPNGGRGGPATGYATPGYGAGGRSDGGRGGDVSRLINTDAGGGYVPDTVRTLGQFVGFGRDLNRRGAKSSSAGTYQINGTTMAEFAPKALGASWKDQPFNADSQERVGEAIFNWAKTQSNPAAALRGRWVSLDPGTASRLVQGTWQQARGTIAQGETGGGAGASAAAGAPGYIGPVASRGAGSASDGDPTLTGDAYLASVPAAERAKIKAIAEGRVAAPRPGTRFGEAVLTKVAQYDPTFDAANSQSRLKTRTDFTSGKSAQAVNALNTAMGHLLHLDTQAKGLGNFSTLPGILNPAYNAARRVAGDTKLPAFQQTKQAAASEMRKVFAGSAGGNLTELKEWQESLDSSQSYEQLHSAIRNGVELMGSRLNALQDQYQTGMGRSDQPMQLIKPGVAKATRQRFGVDLGGHGGSLGAPAARSQPAAVAPSRFRILKVRPK